MADHLRGPRQRCAHHHDLVLHAYSKLTCPDAVTRTAFQAVLMKHMEIPTSPQTMYLKPIRQATMFKHIVSGNVQHTQKSLQVRSD